LIDFLHALHYICCTKPNKYQEIMKKNLILLCAIIFSASILNAQQRVPGPDKLGNRSTTATLSVTELDGTTLTAANLVEAILGPDVTYSNVTFYGTLALGASAGTFTNGIAAGIETIDQGIMLSSGFVLNSLGPNVNDGITGYLGTGGDADLDALVGGGTQDRTVLEFDFIPIAGNIFIDYVFASDEYNEYVNSTYNDVFAFFINGVNIALIPTTAIPVAINNINNGNPYGSLPNSYPEFYLNNDLDDGGPFFDIEADGLTRHFRGVGAVNINQNNHIKIAIADRGDTALDSWVFIEAGSFTTDPEEVPISSWALFIGIGLILAFTVIRFRKLN
jgi:hypothetical protein